MAQKAYPRQQLDDTDEVHSLGGRRSSEGTGLSRPDLCNVPSDDADHEDNSLVPGEPPRHTRAAEVPGTIKRVLSVSSEAQQATVEAGAIGFGVSGTSEQDLSVSSEAPQAAVGEGTNGFKAQDTSEQDLSVSSEERQATAGAGTHDFEVPGTIVRDLSVSSEARQDTVVGARTNGFEQGEGASSDGVSKANARITSRATLRQPSLYERANQQDIPAAPPSFSAEYVVPSMEDLPPVLTIGIKSHGLGGRSLGGESVLSNDLDSTSETCFSNKSQPVRGSNTFSRPVSREVIVAKESSADPHGIEAPTPLGFFRQPSLFERANFGDPGEDGGSRGVDDVKGDNGVDDALGVDEGKGQHSQTLGRGADNTVLRDWLVHVLEKDDQNDPKVRAMPTYHSVVR